MTRSQLFAKSAEEHRRVEEEVRALMRELGLTDALLDHWVERKYETDSHWYDLSTTTKTEIRDDLQGRVDAMKKGAA